MSAGRSDRFAVGVAELLRRPGSRRRFHEELEVHGVHVVDSEVPDGSTAVVDVEVESLTDGLVVTGRAADGTIEAVELDRAPFVVGVQWHPEQDAARDEVRLFSALVAAAQETSSRRREHV